ncbi:discoidin domain-containing protein [Marinoscillum pacificum]|uniref:discoidin domain-containing protein n=1 Tax=Marinoscillum pacificum TaxID=392723 RepID=UPI002157129F|nr:discoidin domain-containing protein [Marinoscillum pacificum]
MKRLIFFCLCLPSLGVIGQVVQLEGLYATSTSLPFESYTVENLFDKDQNTFWKTAKGSGPMEGIMIYFSEPTFINRIEIDKASGDGLAELTYFEVYGDGRSFWDGENIECSLSSLYIKISGTKSTERINSTIGEKEYTRSIFSKDKSVGIREVMIYGEGNRPLDIRPPSFVEGLIEASSSLSPDLAYGPSNLMDSRKDFGWAEGVSGNGVGEYITFSTKEPVTISAIKIWNGYQRSPSHYEGNARLKEFTFGTSDVSGFYSLKDHNSSQLVPLSTSITGTKFILRVKDVYPGSKYQDLVLSEIKFYHNSEPIVINTPIEEERIKKTKTNANALLNTIIDRNIDVQLRSSSEENEGGKYFAEYYFKTTSLILRSNNTFVMYERESTSVEEYIEAEEYENYDTDSKEVIADGNWEIKGQGSDYVKIRIFGKIFSPTTSAELYQGDVTSSNVRIFQDNLTITKDKIVGERFVEEIILKSK